MRYAAVVLYYRLGEQIHDTLEALISQSSPPDRIVLVDNASDDGVLDDAEGRYENLALLQMPSNVGYAAGMNAGAALIDHKVDAVLFMTHEVLLETECAAALLSVLQTDPSTGMVGPALILAETGEIWSLGGLITRFGDVRHNTSKLRINNVEWLDGACLLIRSQSFLECEGFDEDYFLYWEDVDISLRVARFSCIRCVPEAIAYQGTANAPIYLRLRNQILCWRKNRAVFSVVMTVLKAIAKAIFIDSRSGSRQQLRARLVAIVHGFNGRLAPQSIRMIRE